MSRVYFHSPSGTAELRGSERAWLNHIASSPARAAWDLDGSGAFDRACEIVGMSPEPPDNGYGSNYLHVYMREAQEQDRANKAVYAAWKPGTALPAHTSHDPQRRLADSLKTALRVQGIDLDVAGHRLRTADVELNTALVAGSDPVRLAAKLHGWCEVHTWVDGPARAWLADIIDQGLRAGLFRRGLWYSDQPDGPRNKWSDQGWEDVLTLLRSRDDEPVVTSYSVCDQFPNREIAGWEPTIDPEWAPDWAGDGEGRAEWDGYSDDERSSFRRDHALDQWYELPDAAQWEQAMAGLREERPWAQLAPDTLAEVTFGPAVTVYDLFAADRDDRVRKAFASEARERADA